MFYRKRRNSSDKSEGRIFIIELIIYSEKKLNSLFKKNNVFCFVSFFVGVSCAEMSATTAAGAAARTIARRTTFSTAVNIIPAEINSIEQNVGGIVGDVGRLQDDIATEYKLAKPYADVPGPKEFPLIGNSWRFAPIIGKLIKKIEKSFY